MLKPAILCLLFLPAIALAECGVVRTEGVVNILVGRNATTCFVGGFRETFLADLGAGIAEQEQTARAAAEAAREAAARSAAPKRRSSPYLLAPAPGEPAQRYYGQR